MTLEFSRRALEQLRHARENASSALYARIVQELVLIEDAPHMATLEAATEVPAAEVWPDGPPAEAGRIWLNRVESKTGDVAAILWSELRSEDSYVHEIASHERRPG